jgi:hypothetical protein
MGMDYKQLRSHTPVVSELWGWITSSYAHTPPARRSSIARTSSSSATVAACALLHAAPQTSSFASVRVNTRVAWWVEKRGAGCGVPVVCSAGSHRSSERMRGSGPMLRVSPTRYWNEVVGSQTTQPTGALKGGAGSHRSSERMRGSGPMLRVSPTRYWNGSAVAVNAAPGGASACSARRPSWKKWGF